jgi:hypothetical protein
MTYYKIVQNPKSVGTIINTEENFDSERIDRFFKLNSLLKLIYDVSKIDNVSIHYIISQIYPTLFYPEIEIRYDASLLNNIEKIKREILNTNFNISSEFKYFNDFVLNQVRNNLMFESNISLPDRFKSHYFFESIEECLDYYYNLSSIVKKCTIIEVEFIDKKCIYKMDNKYLTNFKNHYTSIDFYKDANDFLIGKISENPLFEIIFQGRYKVNAHVLEL